MKFIRVIKATYDSNNLNTIDKNMLNKIKSKIQLEINEFMEQNFNPFEADSYEDSIDFCKTLMTKPSYYSEDNYENLLNKRIIDENIIKKIGKNNIIKIIEKQLKYYGKDALKDVKLNRDNWDDDFEDDDYYED